MLATMQRSGADFTNTFRSLSRIDPPTTDEGCVVRPQTFDPVLEYILAQSASLEAMRKKSVAAFHPQARCSQHPSLPTSHTSHSSEPHSTSPTTTSLSPLAHHHQLTPPAARPPHPQALQQLQRIAAKDPSKLSAYGLDASVVEREVTRAAQFWRNSAQLF